MNSIFAKWALLPQGWSSDVLVTIDDLGNISSVEKTKRLLNSFSVDILLSAPVNLHSHAFQRAMSGLTERRGPESTDSFWTWRKLMYRFLDQLSPEDIEVITSFVQMEMLEAGYGCNVEFHYLHHQADGSHYTNLHELSERIISATVQSGIGLTLLPVLYEQGGCDNRVLGSGQCRFGNNLQSYLKICDGVNLSAKILPHDTVIGVAPHSLRAVRPDSIHTLSNVSQGPIHMHLAEQGAEVDEVVEFYGLRPTEWLLKNFEINHRWCLIHCTQMNDNETRALAQSQAVVGLCPITESSLGDGIFNGVIFREAEGRFGIGSDSNVRISLTEELRTLEYSQRLRDKSRSVFATSQKSTGRKIFELTCEGGAQAAGRNSGKIETGQLADLLSLNSQHVDLIGRTEDTILDSWIFSAGESLIDNVWSAGRHLVQGGKHVNNEEIIKKYRQTISRLQDVI